MNGFVVRDMYDPFVPSTVSGRTDDAFLGYSIQKYVLNQHMQIKKETAHEPSLVYN
jgi:hypothetical protein